MRRNERKGERKTKGKANEIIKELRTSNSENGYQEAKMLLSQRFRDLYIVNLETSQCKASVLILV